MDAQHKYSIVFDTSFKSDGVTNLKTGLKSVLRELKSVEKQSERLQRMLSKSFGPVKGFGSLGKDDIDLNRLSDMAGKLSFAKIGEKIGSKWSTNLVPEETPTKKGKPIGPVEGFGSLGLGDTGEDIEGLANKASTSAIQDLTKNMKSLTGEEEDFNKKTKKAGDSNKDLRWNMLSVMFTARQFAQVFNGVTSSVLDMTGISKIFGATLMTLFAPVLPTLVTTVTDLFKAFNQLSDEEKANIANMVIGLGVFGAVVGVLSTLVILFTSLGSLASGFGIVLIPLAALLSGAIMEGLGLGDIFTTLAGGVESVGTAAQYTANFINELGDLNLNSLADEFKNVGVTWTTDGHKTVDDFNTWLGQHPWDGTGSLYTHFVNNGLTPIDTETGNTITDIETYFKELKLSTSGVSDFATTLETKINLAKTSAQENLDKLNLDKFSESSNNLADALNNVLKKLSELSDWWSTWGEKISLFFAGAVPGFMAGNAVGGPIGGIIGGGISGTISALLGDLSGWVQDFENVWGNNPVLGSFAVGGSIPSTGLYNLHAGEQVVPANESSPRGDMYVTIQANLSNDMDVDQLARRLESYWGSSYGR